MKYTATARRDGRWWVVQCDQHPAALSQVARFSQAAAHQREAIAFVTGADEATIDVEVRPALTPAVASLVADARKTRAQADALSRDAVTLAKKAAQALAEQGFTVRDVGAALGVSFQRAHQLLTVKSAS